MTKVQLGYALGVLGVIGCGAAAWVISTTAMALAVTGTMGLASGLAGWTTGILLTPKSRKEKKAFSKYGGAIATFLAGFGVAQVQQLLAWFSQGSDLLVGRVVIATSMFFLGLLFVFVGRSYWRDRNDVPPPEPLARAIEFMKRAHGLLSANDPERLSVAQITDKLQLRLSSQTPTQ